MTTKKYFQALIIAFAMIVGAKSSALADSPLTSTAISQAYQTEPIVQQAAAANGTLTPELADYLMSKKNPVASKIALINELGWDFDGRNNAGIFLDHLLASKKYKSEKDVLKKAPGDVLISLAYLKALDNYFEVGDAIAIADKALLKSKKSYSVHIIAALIKAQEAMETDFCEAYRLTHEVSTNTALKQDLSAEAVTIIFDYMNLYQEGC